MTHPAPSTVEAVPGFPAAGGAGRWYEAMMRTTDTVVVDDDGSGSVLELGAEKPAICPAPTFGATIDAILTEPRAEVAHPAVEQPGAGTGADPEPPGRRRHRTPLPAVEGPRGKTAAEDDRRRATPAGATLRGPCPPEDASGLPTRATPSLLAPYRPSASAATPAATAARPVGTAPAPVSVSKGPHPTASHPASAPPRDRAHHDPRRRLADRLGVDDPADLAPALDVAVGTGPVIPVDRLGRLAGRDQWPDPSPAPVGSGSTNPAPSRLGPGDRSEPGTVAGAHSPTRGRGRSMDPPNPAIDGTAAASPAAAARSGQPLAHQHGDLSPIRQVSDHQELPQVPDRERATAPVVRHRPDEEPQPDALSDRLITPPASPPIERHDLERQMKSILDEAARRHGIEI